MRIISAFFADYVAIHSEKLFVQGGVWDWYMAGAASDLPVETVMPLAVIAQVSPEDRGRTHRFRVGLTSPEDRPVFEISADVTSQFSPDHLAMAMHVPMRFDQGGRHVFLLQVGDDVENAFALPIKVITTA